MNCCKHKKSAKTCKRKIDGKTFKLPRRFTMKSSCAPYKHCIKGGNNSHTCVAVLSGDVNGVVNFFMKNDKCVVSYNINGLKDGKHGFHIHRCGDMTKGCISGCEHFNPEGVSHGDRNSTIRHAGDLGNIISKNNKAKGEFSVLGITTNPTKKQSIIGRMIIVHADEDDLGRGKNKESAKTGNAGVRLACGVIGITE
jgi:superoxide dismutase, Cu-Zn family